MKAEKIAVPEYKLTLSAEEMAELWLALYDAQQKGDKRAAKLFNQLENIRPAGGFGEMS